MSSQIQTSNEKPELLEPESVQDLGRLNHNVILDLFQNPVLNFGTCPASPALQAGLRAQCEGNFLSGKSRPVAGELHILLIFGT